MSVDGKLLLIALELLPVEVALVIILQQDLAVLERTLVSAGLARSAINNLGSVDRSAVGARTGVEDASVHQNQQQRSQAVIASA